MKKSMKRLVLLALAGVMVFTLAACGKTAKKANKRNIVGVWTYEEEASDEADGFRFNEISGVNKYDEKCGQVTRYPGGGMSLSSYYYTFLSDTEVKMYKITYGDDGDGVMGIFVLKTVNGRRALVCEELGETLYFQPDIE